MSSKFKGLLDQARNRESLAIGNDVEDFISTSDSSSQINGASERAEDNLPSPVTQQPTKRERDESSRTVARKTERKCITSLVPEIIEKVPRAGDDAPRRGRRKTGKRSDPTFTQITAYISKTTHQNIKLELLKEGEGREISELIEELLSRWLNGPNI